MKRISFLVIAALLFTGLTAGAQAQWWHWSAKARAVTVADPATLFGAGTPTAGVVSGSDITIAAAIPAVTITAGMDIIVHVSHKFQITRPNIPTGFRRIDTWIASTANNGTDQGPSVSTLFHKTAVGGESGTISITIPSANSGLATVYVISKQSGFHLHYKIVAGAHNTPNTTAYSAGSWSPIETKKNDLVLALTSVNCDTYGWSLQAISQSGVTFETVTQEIVEAGTNVGNDQEQFSSLFKVTSSGTRTGRITYIATSSGANSAPANPTGITLFVRIRQSRQPFTWPPSGLMVWDADNVVETSATGEGSSIWDGHRVSMEGPAATSTRYKITNFGGRACFHFIADITTGVNSRTEVADAPIDPLLPEGTQYIEEIKWLTNAWHNNPSEDNPADNDNSIKEWIFQQHHPGGAAGYSSNHPSFYFAFSYAGQTGWGNFPGASPGGEFVISNNVSLDRYRFPDIDWAANSTYKIRYHYKAHSTDGCLKVWVNDDLIYEYYGRTVPLTGAELGTNPLVAGHSKKGVYHHGIDDAGDVTDQIAAGHKGIQLLTPSIKMILQLPGDVDYISDVTNNSNPIYNYVDTTND
jgi:hypothetical protein